MAATTIVQYVQIMRNAQWDLARKLGADLSAADRQTRVLMISTLAVQAVLIEVLVAKGVVKDAELLGALNAARADPSYLPPVEPVYPVIWNTDPVTGF
jgi:hypothetical protein